MKKQSADRTGCLILQDDLYGEKSWELAESKMVQTAMHMAAQKAGKKLEDINYLIGGDLINQIVPSSFAARELGIPFFGIYGACSTMAEGMCLSAMLIDGGFADLILSGASSHYCTAERQFRFPLELGNQKPMTAQWTVTGAGSVLIAPNKEGPKVKYVTVGKVIDEGIDDGNNMGPAMAPAAVDTIYSYFILLFVIELVYILLLKQEYWKSKKHCFLLAASMIGSVLFRNNGKYVTYPMILCTLLTVFLQNRNQRTDQEENQDTSRIRKKSRRTRYTKTFMTAVIMCLISVAVYSGFQIFLTRHYNIEREGLRKHYPCHFSRPPVKRRSMRRK